jgi:hypothetical protein
MILVLIGKVLWSDDLVLQKSISQRRRSYEQIHSLADPTLPFGCMQHREDGPKLAQCGGSPRCLLSVHHERVHRKELVGHHPHRTDGGIEGI